MPVRLRPRLITGKRDAISTPVNDAMYISSLAHVLSISGYHMAVVAGVVFFAIRALLALMAGVATRYPIKKWGAAGALVAAALYLALSGAEVATQRAFIMTAIVLVGVMADRAALTLRTLAVAAHGGPAARAGSRRASEFSDVVCGDLGAGGRLRAWAAVDQRRTRQRARHPHRAVGRAPGHCADLCLAGGGPRDHALCGLPFSPHRAVWRAGEFAGDAGGVGLGDAGGPAGAARDAVRLRRAAVAADGEGDRLDGRGRAVGREPARRARPRDGVRRRRAAARDCRIGRGVPAQIAAAMGGRGADRHRRCCGRRDPAAGCAVVVRRRRGRGAHRRRQIVGGQVRQRFICGARLAGGRCRCAQAERPDVEGRVSLRRRWLRGAGS